MFLSHLKLHQLVCHSQNKEWWSRDTRLGSGARDTPYRAKRGNSHSLTAHTVDSSPTEAGCKALGAFLCHLHMPPGWGLSPKLAVQSWTLWYIYALSPAIKSPTLLSTGKVLVHCAMGISRSATLVLAFLMICEDMSLADAIQAVRSHRGICPNSGFLEQLRELDLRLRKEKRAGAGIC